MQVTHYTHSLLMNSIQSLFTGAMVLLATALSWVLTGKLIQLFFPSLSLLFFLIIGLASGLLLALLLPSIHPEPEHSPASAGVPS